MNNKVDLINQPNGLDKIINVVVRYSLSLVVVAIGLAIRMFITVWIGPGLPTYITFYPAVLVAALLAGFGPGVLATLCSTFVVLHWTVPPAGVFIIETPIGLAGVLLFTSFGIFMCFVVEFYRRIQRKATEEIRVANERLEERIKERTAELKQTNNDLRTARRATLNLLEDMKLSGEKIEKINIELQNEIIERKKFDEAMRESEGRFRTLVTATSDIIYKMNPDWSEMRWLSGGDVIADTEKPSRSWLEVYIPQDDQPQVKENINNAIRMKSTFQLEHRVLRTDGTFGWVFSRAVPRLDNQGEIKEWFGAASDITERKLLQEQLEGERDFVNAVLQTSGALITVIDTNGRITRFNKACETLTGYTADEVKGRTAFDLFILPEEREDVLGVAARLFGGERTLNYENHWVTKSGEKRYIRWRNSMLLDDKGVPMYAVATGIDITDRKRAEEALRESDERLRFAQQVAQIGTFDWNIITGVIIWTPELEAIYGLEPGEFGKTQIAWEKLIHPEDRPTEIALVKKAFETGDPVSGEWRVVWKDGSVHWINGRFQAFKDAGGKPLRLTGVNINITEQKKAEESQARLSAIVENSINAIIGKTTDGIITSWNAGAQKIYGYTESEVVGKDISIIAPLGNIDEIPDILKRVKKGESVTNIDTIRMRKDGTLVPVSLTMSPVKNARGTVVGASTIAYDISDIKRIEEQLKQRANDLEITNKELESFSYSVAHDLRNPLKVIKGFIGFLKDDCADKLGDECKDYVDRISLGADRMTTIIDDMLALSKISRQDMEIKTIDLSSLAHLTIQELISANPPRNVQVTIQEGMNVNADARLMSVALGNLLGNAWKYTGKTEDPKIEFGFFTKKDKKIYFVKDNGAGFDMSQTAKLFVPFRRLHSDKEFKGTGVGLAIVERAITRHGGKIWAEGEPGKGATFYFTLG